MWACFRLSLVLKARHGQVTWLHQVQRDAWRQFKLLFILPENAYLIPKGTRTTHCRSPEPRVLLLILLQVPDNCHQPLDKDLLKAELPSWKKLLEIIRRGRANCVSRGHVDLCLGTYSIYQQQTPVVELWCGAAVPHHPGKPPVSCSAVASWPCLDSRSLGDKALLTLRLIADHFFFFPLVGGEGVDLSWWILSGCIWWHIFFLPKCPIFVSWEIFEVLTGLLCTSHLSLQSL